LSERREVAECRVGSRMNTSADRPPEGDHVEAAPRLEAGCARRTRRIA
jgi:hypothetical protein